MKNKQQEYQNTFKSQDGTVVYQSHSSFGFLSFLIEAKGKIITVKEKGVSQETWKHVNKNYQKGHYKIIFNHSEIKSEALINEIVGFLVIQNKKCIGNFSKVLVSQVPNLFEIISLQENDEPEIRDLLNLLICSGRLDFDGIDSRKFHNDVILQKCVAIALKYHKEQLCNEIHNYEEKPFFGGTVSSFLDDYERDEGIEGTIRDMNFANSLWF